MTPTDRSREIRGLFLTMAHQWRGIAAQAAPAGRDEWLQGATLYHLAAEELHHGAGLFCDPGLIDFLGRHERMWTAIGGEEGERYAPMYREAIGLIGSRRLAA